MAKRYGIFWLLHYMYLFDVRLLITPVVSFVHCIVCTSSMYGFWLPLWYLLAIALSVPLRCTVSDYPFGILWPLHCLYLFDVRLLITPVVSFVHCIICTSSMYGFWLPLWYLMAIALSVPLRCTASDYPCGIFWPLLYMYQRGNQKPYIEEVQTMQWP
jgi:hypothetical protein